MSKTRAKKKERKMIKGESAETESVSDISIALEASVMQEPSSVVAMGS